MPQVLNWSSFQNEDPKKTEHIILGGRHCHNIET